MLERFIRMFPCVYPRLYKRLMVTYSGQHLFDFGHLTPINQAIFLIISYLM